MLKSDPAKWMILIGFIILSGCTNNRFPNLFVAEEKMMQDCQYLDTISETSDPGKFVTNAQLVKYYSRQRNMYFRRGNLTEIQRKSKHYRRLRQWYEKNNPRTVSIHPAKAGPPQCSIAASGRRICARPSGPDLPDVRIGRQKTLGGRAFDAGYSATQHRWHFEGN